jgi:PAS domain-containing protein
MNQSDFPSEETEDDVIFDSCNPVEPIDGHAQRARRRRTSSFGESIRKFSLIDEAAHGLIEARGVDLAIVTADPTVCRMLGWSGEGVAPHPDHPLPTSVHDLLPPETRAHHRRLLERAAAAGALPDAVRTPLTGVRILRLDGSAIRVNVMVGLVDPAAPIDPATTLFYALLTEATGPAAAGEAGRGGAAARRQSRSEEKLESIGEALYGRSVAQTVSMGVLPPPEEFPQVRSRWSSSSSTRSFASYLCFCVPVCAQSRSLLTLSSPSLSVPPSLSLSLHKSEKTRPGHGIYIYKYR